MKRRSFLKLLGFTPAVAALPEVVRAANPVGDKPFTATDVEDSIREFSGKMREIAAYELSDDRYRVRFDIMARGEQYHVDARLDVLSEEEMFPLRMVATTVLGDLLAHKGMSWSDVERMPLPAGVAWAKYT